MKERLFPRVRLDCLSREFGDDVLVYDLQRDMGHCLNSTAAAAWKLCDGNSSPSQIARTLSRRLSAQVDEQVVLLALDQLANAHLLVEPEVPVELPSRRVAIRRIAVAAAIVLPLVTSIVARPDSVLLPRSPPMHQRSTVLLGCLRFESLRFGLSLSRQVPHPACSKPRCV